jgi:glycosyltransferase involved in cell wall biosynthesis
MSTLIVLSGGNYIHRKFGEIIGAQSFMLPARATKFQSFPSKVGNLMKGVMSIPPGYGITICESCYQYPAIKRKLFLLKTKIVNINGGPMLYHVLSGRLSKMEQKILRGLISEVDGHIVYGEYGRELLAQFDVKKPIKVVYPFIREATMAELAEVKPDLNTHTVSLIAKMDAYNKGVDIAVQAIKIVARKYPDVKLNLITSQITDHELSEMEGYDRERIRIHRDIPKIAWVYANSSLYVHPARGDMFPVSCLEAMAAGVPVITSEDSGAKEVVKKIDEKMVVPVGAEQLASAIIRYFDMPPAEREALSVKSREQSGFFNEKDMVELFKKEFDLLVGEIDIPYAKLSEF